VQQEIIVIPKTSRLERLKENAAIFDFQLKPAEMKEIAALASPHGNIVS
jgi:diketogulonate reductase-like aldo/keto reductase